MFVMVGINVCSIVESECMCRMVSMVCLCVCYECML